MCKTLPTWKARVASRLLFQADFWCKRPNIAWQHVFRAGFGGRAYWHDVHRGWLEKPAGYWQEHLQGPLSHTVRRQARGACVCMCMSVCECVSFYCLPIPALSARTGMGKEKGILTGDSFGNGQEGQVRGRLRGILRNFMFRVNISSSVTVTIQPE